MNVAEFVTKWRKLALTERSASQQHFPVSVPSSNIQHPPKSIQQVGTSLLKKGPLNMAADRADVWKKNFFGWE